MHSRFLVRRWSKGREYANAVMLGNGELSERDFRLTVALRAARIGIWDWDILTGRMSYSSRAREIYGFTPDQLVTIDDVRAATHADDLPRTAAMAERALDPAFRECPVFEFRLKSDEKSAARWAIAYGEAVFERDAAGNDIAVRYVGTIEDISASKAMESAYLNAQLTQRLAINAAKMAVWEFDVKTERVKGSPELNRLYGFQRDETPSIDEFRQCYLPGERDKVRAAALAAIEIGQTEFEVEFRIARRDGVERCLLLRGEIITDIDGNHDRVVGVVMDIDERKRAEQQRELMMRELNHRVKNSLSVVLAIASQTFRNATDIPIALDAFRARVQALAIANDVIVENDWTGFDLSSLVDRITSPYRQAGNDPFDIRGEHTELPPAANVPLALAFHELCTNAAKYGALSMPEGCVHLHWRTTDDHVLIEWREEGGPVPVEGTSGFGTTMMRRVLSQEFDHFELEMQPTGAVCSIRIKRP